MTTKIALVLAASSFLLGAVGPAHALPFGGKAAATATTPAKRGIKKYVVAGAAALAIGGTGLHVSSTYNGLVSEHESVKAEWSEIQNNLQRRADLIPNLVEVAKGYASFEQSTLIAVAQARAAMKSATTAPAAFQANQQMAMALMPILAVQEAYPNLKANENFKALTTSLTDTENRLLIARSRYNDAAAAYNVHRLKFPTNVLANRSGFTEAAYFKASAGAEQPITIDLSVKK